MILGTCKGRWWILGDWEKSGTRRHNIKPGKNHLKVKKKSMLFLHLPEIIVLENIELVLWFSV